MSKAIDPATLSSTVSPGEDFYQFVNGSWAERTEIPSDRGRWGSFDELRKLTNERSLALLKDRSLMDSYAVGTDEWKALAFFNTAMDTDHLERQAFRPVEPLLERARGVVDVPKLWAFVAETAATGLYPLISLGAHPDMQDSRVYSVYMSAGRLGLPDRAYYFDEDEENQRIIGEYKLHIARMLELASYEAGEAERLAGEIFTLEKRLAEHMLTKEDKRDPSKIFNPRRTEAIAEMLPEMDIAGIFRRYELEIPDRIVITEPGYFDALAGIMGSVAPGLWRDFLVYSVMNHAAPYLHPEVEMAHFRFYGRVLNGVEHLRPRDERMLDMTNAMVGEALGKVYVKRYFPAEAKERASEMVEHIIEAFGDRIRRLTWMSESTRERALHKLRSFRVKIGYPDQWRSYAELAVASAEEGGSFYGNAMAAGVFEWMRDMRRAGREVDRDEWYMAPQVVNAYYHPLFNEIVFPAAILQPPFYYYDADAAVNYGGIGAVIGHEITHGFDDQGSRFDEAGNLCNWWTEEDRRAFEQLNERLVAQYDAYEAFPGVRVNGRFTLGENLGDLGGVNLAFDGLQRHLAQTGARAEIDGLSPEQRFFISWARIWRTKYRDDALKTQIRTDPHSPGHYRAVGPLVNVDAFYEAFDIREGSPLYRAAEERVRIW